MKTIDEIRRDNLLLAIERADGASRLADVANVSAAYLSQIKNRSPESKTGKPKTMGDDVARKIERAINEQEGWMDTPHDEGAGANQAAKLVAMPTSDYVSASEIMEMFELYAASEKPYRDIAMNALRSGAAKAAGRRGKTTRKKL